MGGPVFPSAIYLGPNYGGGNEDNGDLTQKTPCMPCYSSCPQPHTFTGKSPVGSLFLSPGFWCRGSVVPPKSLFPSPMQVQAAPWWGQRWPPPRGSMQYLHPVALSLRQTTTDPYFHRRHSNTVLSQSLWGPWVLVCTRFVWALWVSLAGMGFDSKCEFAPPTIFLELLLCPWTWGIPSQLFQCLLSYWDFSDLGRRVSQNHNHRKLTNLITWTTALSNSMKLWAIPCRDTQDGRVMVESSDKMWSTGEGNGNLLQYSCLENPMDSMKRQKDRTLKEELPRLVGAQYASGDQWRNNSKRNEEMETKQKQYPVVDVTGDGSRVQCCKEQYWIGTWNEIGPWIEANWKWSNRK